MYARFELFSVYWMDRLRSCHGVLLLAHALAGLNTVWARANALILGSASLLARPAVRKKTAPGNREGALQ